jgi:pyruvate dehydrogenase E2 component (dihydrolipoamide acetyltransferase)
MIEFRMPSLGADMESGFLREWKVKPGDRVKRGDIIAEVETQKGIIDIEVFDEGIVGELLIQVDEKVPVGVIMTHILSSLEDNIAPAKETIAEKSTPVSPAKPIEEKKSTSHTAQTIRASPLAKRIATEKKIDLSRITGTGPGGEILRADVEKAANEAVSKAGSEKTPGENIRLAVAAAMSKSNREIPHYYLRTKVDMGRALTWLAENNKQRTVQNRLLPVVMLIKAVGKALVDVPDLNAWWENGLQRKADVNVGFVVSLRTGGIIVPGLHRVQEKSLDELMKMLSDIIPRARALKLRSSELADSTITVTSLGEGAVETVYGVIYPPQVALVGFGGITEQPWAENGMLGVKPVLTITLSADHRATDGNVGNQFLMSIKNYLRQPETLYETPKNSNDLLS